MNKIKSEVEVAGYRFVLDMNALANLEELTGEGAFLTLAKMNTGEATVSALRNFCYACLRRHQPDITIEEAGDFLSEHIDALHQVISAAFPEEEASGNGKKPTKK